MTTSSLKNLPAFLRNWHERGAPKTVRQAAGEYCAVALVTDPTKTDAVAVLFRAELECLECFEASSADLDDPGEKATALDDAGVAEFAQVTDAETCCACCAVAL